VGYKPGPPPAADASRAEVAKKEQGGTRASSRVRRESGKFADLAETEPKKEKKKKKKKGANQYTKAKELGQGPPKKQKKSKEPKRVAETTTSGGATGQIVEMSQKDAAMTSQRRLRPTLAEPAYDLELVPDATRDMANSALRRVEGTAAWEKLLAEAMLLCNEAAWRRLGKDRAVTVVKKELNPPDAKPLMLEYISDRIDTDEPLWGYAVRTSREGWLQGFVCITQFTTWCPYFRWSASAPSAAVTLDDYTSHAVDGIGPGSDAEGSLCRELQASRRFGDCDGEGVVWPRIAEVSLLGGLGTGRTLMDIVVAEVADRGDADFVVLQATDQAVPFYERLGFSKVGAVASFEEKGKSLPREAMCGLCSTLEQLDNDGFTPAERARARLAPEALKKAEGRPLKLRDGAWCYVCKEDDTVTSVCDKLDLPEPAKHEVVTANKSSLYGLTQKSRVMGSTIFALPANYAEHLLKCPLAVDEQTVEGSTSAVIATATTTGDAMRALRASPQKAPPPPPAPTLGARLYWARRMSRAALRSIQALDEYRVFWEPVSAETVPHYRSWVAYPLDFTTIRKRLVDGAAPLELRDAYLPEDLAVDFRLMWANCSIFNGADSWLANYGRRVGKQAQDILDRFSRTHAHLHGLREDLQKDDWDLDEETRNFHRAAETDPSCMGYVHWTFPDQTVEDQYPSYLMARRVRPLDEGVYAALVSTADDAVLKLANVGDAAFGFSEKARLSAQRCLNKARKVYGTSPDPPPRDPPIPREPTRYELSSQYEKSPYARRMEDTDEAALRPATQCISARVAPADPQRPAPSNVTPRGRGFTAKLARGGAVEYLGIFPDRRSAQAIYDKASSDWSATNNPEQPGRPFAVPDPPLEALKRRDACLAKACPEHPVPMRAAALKSETEPNDGAGLRSRVQAHLDSRAITPPADVYLSPRSRKRPLYNAIVRIIDQPPCYAARYWFVYQYVSDMEFCHLCPMETHGLFDKNTTRHGRPRWRLCPEGQCREVDVGAARLKLVKHKTVGKTPSADKEVWDVLEDEAENLKEALANPVEFIESDGEEKVAPSVALGTKSRSSPEANRPSYPCPAGCARKFSHAPAATQHGKSCAGAKLQPPAAPLPPPVPPPPAPA